MRLSEFEKKAIIDVLNRFVEPTEIKIYLYGSRVDDAKNGGDIDLLVLCENDELKEKLKLTRAKILAQLYIKIGEQKIDLLFATESELNTDPFLKMIITDCVLLSRPAQA